MSKSQIAFATAAEGDSLYESFTVQNTTKTVKTFEFAIPPGACSKHSGLKVSPLVGTLKPGASTRIEVNFTPGQHIATRQAFDKSRGAATVNGELSGTAEVERAGDIDNDDVVDGSMAVVDDDGGKDSVSAGGDSADVEESTAAAANGQTAGSTSFVEEIGSVPPAIGSIEFSPAHEPYSCHAKWLLPCFVQDVDHVNGTGPTLFLGIQVRRFLYNTLCLCKT